MGRWLSALARWELAFTLLDKLDFAVGGMSMGLGISIHPS